ncbi:MAG: DUF2335 domain-containing protein [Bacteroidetes bacterium]|nr:DUF2335 domain-containing protein [Bacteroidota bacterium]
MSNLEKKTSESDFVSSEANEILKEIDPKLLQGIPETKRKDLVKAIVVSVQKVTSGPLPNPDDLVRYNEIIPNGADRIMKMAETQLSHRIKQENKVISSQVGQSYLGQIFAFVIGTTTILSGAYCILSGYEFAGSFLGTAGLLGLVTAFIQGRQKNRQNIESKNPSNRR